MKRLVVVAFGMLLLSSCGLFRKKNRCHTCPSWNKTETSATAVSHDRI